MALQPVPGEVFDFVEVKHGVERKHVSVMKEACMAIATGPTYHMDAEMPPYMVFLSFIAIQGFLGLCFRGSTTFNEDALVMLNILHEKFPDD